MNGSTRYFRLLLPILQTLLGAAFGGVGLWQRHQILNQRLWGNETLWHSTAAFHVWPWPYKFALITNVPAFLFAALVDWPLQSVWPNLPDAIGWMLCLCFIALVWYHVGSRFDAAKSFRQRQWTVLLAFMVLAATGVLTPGYIGFVLFAVALWMVFYPVALSISRSSRVVAEE